MRIGRLIAILVGLVLTVVSLVLLVTSIWALALVGFDNTLNTGTKRFESPTAAIASAEASLGDDSLPDRKRSSEEDWDLRVKAAAKDGKELFVGIGPSEEVDAYLADAPWDKVTAFSFERFSSDISDVSFDREGKSGDPAELPAPTDQDFWTISDSGTDVSLDWDYREGHHTIVLMNADGSTGIDADASIRLKIPRLSLALSIMTGAGIFLLLVGLVLLFRVGRGRRSSDFPAT